MKPPETKKVLRCVLYTRVSTEYGLEQEFNSLDAQRESSEAYVRAKPMRAGGFSPPNTMMEASQAVP
jgi:hypothetical protein